MAKSTHSLKAKNYNTILAIYYGMNVKCESQIVESFKIISNIVKYIY